MEEVKAAQQEPAALPPGLPVEVLAAGAFSCLTAGSQGSSSSITE